VSGYVPATIDVYPFVGRRVVLGSDMPPSPSVLLRVPASARELLGDGTRIIVRLMGDRGAPMADAATSKNRSAFLLGRHREVPATLRGDWEIELEADGVTRSNADTVLLRAKMLKEWRNPSELATVTLEPGMTLVAELRAPGGVVAVATRKLNTEPFQDVALRSPKE